VCSSDLTIDVSDGIDAQVAAALAHEGPAVVHVRTSLQQLSAFHTMAAR
jgi:hypothetical protein